MNKILITLLTIMVNVSAFALENNFYTGLNVGLGSVENLSNVDLGLSANAGYKFNQNFALETSYTYFTYNNVWANSPINTYANGISQGDTMFLMGVAKGILPLNNKFDLFGKLGIGYSYSSLTNSGEFTNGCCHAFTPASLMAGGINFNINQHVGVNLEFANYMSSNTNGLGNANLTSLGLNYSF